MVLCPEIKDYLICADGVSKSLCATGVRVGWIFGPKDVIGKMSEILSHIGAWAPKPEQAAVAKFLDNYDAMVDFVKGKTEIYSRIVQTICNKFQEMKDKGFRVDYQRSEGGIYISIYLDYVHSFGSTEEYISFLINRCGLGIVPFEYFGSSQNKGWFRISIGNISLDNIDPVLKTIKNAIVSSVTEVNSRIF
jgi:aspartate aminotransferase